MKKVLFLSLLAVSAMTNAYAKPSSDNYIDSSSIEIIQNRTVKMNKRTSQFDSIVLQAFAKADEAKLENAIAEIELSFSYVNNSPVYSF